MSDTHPFYRAWKNMRHRCECPTSTQYKWYGGRGITYCERWKYFLFFYDDMFSSWREGLTLDRKEVSQGYSKENCRWVTKEEQAQNQGLRTDNTSGCKGVSLQYGLWRAVIHRGGRRIQIGYFTSFEAAAAARKKVEEAYASGRYGN